MATIIGQVQNIDGKFFTKNQDGQITELHLGDVITKDMLVFGDKANPSNAKLQVLMSDENYIVTINGSQEQLFDSYTVDSDDVNIEEALAQSSIDTALTQDIDSLLNDDDNTNPDDIVLPDEATAAGDETLEGGESVAVFDSRDGNAVDVNSDLRDAQFFTTQDVETTQNSLLT